MILLLFTIYVKQFYQIQQNILAVPKRPGHDLGPNFTQKAGKEAWWVK